MNEVTTNNKNIVFIEHNPFMSVELLDLIKSYKIICYNDDHTYRLLGKNWILSSYLNTNFTKEPDSDVVAETILRNKIFMKKAIPDKKNSRILFFYMNSTMDSLIKQNKLTMALPPFYLQERIGSKIYLTEMCKKLGIPQNDYLIFTSLPNDRSLLLSQCKSKLGSPFILQGDQGESGWDVSLIYTESDLKNALKKVKKRIRVSKYLAKNIPLSVHITILEHETIIHGPFMQLIGFSELSAGPFRFTGNDTNQSLLTLKVIDSVNKYTTLISNFVKSEGFRGILGIDYLWDLYSDTVFPQEINSRLVGLTRLLTGIQKDQNVLPDLVKHIMNFANIELTEKGNSLDNKIKISDCKCSQLIVRNNLQKNILITKRIEPGIYKIVGGEIRISKQSLFFEDMGEDEFLITSSAHKGCTLTTNEALIRMLVKRSVTKENEYKLTSETIELIDKIRKYTTSND